MTSPAESFESYKHLYAKQVLAGWFREIAIAVGFDGCAEYDRFAWRVNRGEPDWGVHIEYPIARSNNSCGQVLAWDETFWNRVPSVQELWGAHDRVEAVLDVAIQHKGAIVFGFEVVHTNPVNAEKASFLDTLSIVTYEISAEWIMRQVRRPEQLETRTKFGRPIVWGWPA